VPGAGEDWESGATGSAARDFSVVQIFLMHEVRHVSLPHLGVRLVPWRPGLTAGVNFCFHAFFFKDKVTIPASRRQRLRCHQAPPLFARPACPALMKNRLTSARCSTDCGCSRSARVSRTLTCSLTSVLPAIHPARWKRWRPRVAGHQTPCTRDSGRQRQPRSSCRCWRPKRGNQPPPLAQP